jgi:hypothetical protein
MTTGKCEDQVWQAGKRTRRNQLPAIFEIAALRCNVTLKFPDLCKQRVDAVESHIQQTFMSSAIVLGTANANTGPARF